MDEDLRELERTARAGGDPRAARRLALAYDRAGRGADALSALTLGREDEEIRAELAARWDRAYAREAYYLDAAPVRSPSLRWHADIPTELGSVSHLLPTSLGVLCRTRSHIGLLDAQSGEARYWVELSDAQGARSLRAYSGPTALLTTLVNPEQWTVEVTVRDLWTGEALATTPLPIVEDLAYDIAIGHDLLVFGNCREVRGYRFTDLHRPLEQAWRFETRTFRPKVSLTPNRVLIHPTWLSALEHDGTHVWTRPIGPRATLRGFDGDDAVFLDARGSPVHIGSIRLASLRDGRTREWSRRDDFEPLALTPSWVVVRLHDGADWNQIALGYRRGATLWKTGLRDARAVRVGGDLAYVLHDPSQGALTLSAVGLNESTWSLSVEDLGGAHYGRDPVETPLALGPGCIYFKVGRHRVACVGGEGRGE